MCGELEDEEQAPGAQVSLYGKFLRDAQDFLALCQREDESTGLSGYMDRLFSRSLSSCLQDLESQDDATRSELLLAQPVVLARLAGFLAGHVARAEDPLRQVIDALLAGYGEAQGTACRADLPMRTHHHSHDQHG